MKKKHYAKRMLKIKLKYHITCVMTIYVDSKSIKGN